MTSSPILDLGHFSQVILPIVLQAICPTIRCCSQHLMVGVIFFFDLFSHSGLRAFFTSDFANCTTNYALPKNNPNHQVLFTASDGWVNFFFLTSSPILDLGHFSQVILPIVLQAICPTIRCCSQHLMVGVNFFFDLFSHSGLRAFFTSDFANCTTNYGPKITPTIRCCEQHLMVGGFFFLTSSPILDLGHFSQVILPIVLQAICPTIRCCSQHLMVGVIFFLTSSPILDLEHFLQVILPIVITNCQLYQFCPCPKITTTIRCCSQHLMVGLIFF